MSGYQCTNVGFTNDKTMDTHHDQRKLLAPETQTIVINSIYDIPKNHNVQLGPTRSTYYCDAHILRNNNYRVYNLHTGVIPHRCTRNVSITKREDVVYQYEQYYVMNCSIEMP